MLASETGSSCSFFFFECSGDHRDLHSFPTRRSSDLLPSGAETAPRRGWPRPRAGGQATAWRLGALGGRDERRRGDRKSTRLNSSHVEISYAVFCLKKKKKEQSDTPSKMDKYDISNTE